MSVENSLKIDYLLIKKASLVLRAINHKLRQQIIKMLDEKQRMTVTDIYIQLRLEQSVVSQHLAILRRAGVVQTERDGKYIYYLINYDRFAHITNVVSDLLN
jgi:DNA-binding transcriptional ArsR family regulator